MKKRKITTRIVLLLLIVIFARVPTASAQSTCIPSDPPGEFPALPETITERTGDIAETQQLAAEDIGEIQSLLLSPDGLYVVAQGEQGLHILDPVQGTILYTICEEVNRTAISPDGRTLVVMGDDAVQFRDVYSGESVAELEESWMAAAFTPDGFFMVVQDADGNVSLRDIVSQEIVYTVDDVLSFAASPAGDFLAVVTETDVQVLDLVSGDPVTTLDVSDVYTLKFNRSGSWLATAGDVVTLWDVETWQPAFELEGDAVDITFDPLDEFVAITSEEGLDVWELEDGTLLDQIDCENCGPVLAHLTGIITADSAHLIFVEFSP